MENLQKNIQKLLNLFKSKKFLEAEKFGKELIKVNPKIVFLYNVFGLILMELKKIDEAIICYNKAINIQKDYSPVYDNLGTAYRMKGDFVTAELHHKKSISLNNNAHEPQNNLGNLYLSVNKIEEAINCYKRAININPKLFISQYNLGIAYKMIGKFNEAKKYFEEAIRLNVFFYTAHRTLSQLTQYTTNNKHYEILNKIYNNPKIKKIEKTELYFALGKAAEDMKDFNKAFNYYLEGNKLRRKKISFSIKREKNNFANIKRVFSKELFIKFKNVGNFDSTPIFILGMPRSGTTLVEQILASHPKVFGGDELRFLVNLVEKYIYEETKNPLLKDLLNFDNKRFSVIGREYLDKLKNLSHNSERITDKLPINFKWIGFIKLILPNSKIIHCVRNSKDTCLSIFKNYFANPELNFAYNLNEISEFYNLYFDLMAYWKEILPKFIIDVKYEKLIDNPDDEIQRLLLECNLEWNSNCLNYYNTERSIKTASDTQARKKIYKSSLDTWIKYEKNLKGAFNKLLN